MKKLTVAVHSGRFHADEVFALAIIRMVFGDIELIRTRNTEDFMKADLRIDVGLGNNPSTGDYDHHMPGGAGLRPNGVPYASCGLVWKDFGMRLVDSKAQFEQIDQKIIQTIDAIDCGVQSAREGHLYTISDLLDSFNTVWNEEDVQIERFTLSCNIAIQILTNEIRRARAETAAEDMVRGAIAESAGKKYLLLPSYCPWQKIVSGETDFLFVVFQEQGGGGYRIRAVPVEDDSFEVRKKLPSGWGGLRDSDLAKASGVSDATFCHPALFIAGARSLEGALKMAEIAADEK